MKEDAAGIRQNALKQVHESTITSFLYIQIPKGKNSAGIWVVFGILMIFSAAFVTFTVCKRRIKKKHDRRLNEPLDDRSEPAVQFSLLRAQESKSSQDGTP